MEEQLEDYNMEPGIIPMGLVLFRDAIEHGTVSSVLYIILFSVFTINKGVITAKLGYMWTTIAHNCVESFPTHMAHTFSNYKNL